MAEALTTREMLREIVRAPGARIVGAVAVVVVAFAGVAGKWVWDQAQVGSCTVHKHRDLEIEELIAVKKRFMAYRKAPEQGMRLTGEELAMLIEDQTESPVFLEVHEDRFRAEVVIARKGDKCWPLDVSGQVKIEDGKAFVKPEVLEIGALELTALVRDLNIELLPEHMPSARSANLLQKTRTAEVRDGAIEVKLTDPDASLFTND